MMIWSTPNRRRTIRARRTAHLAGSGYPMPEAKAEEMAEPAEKPKRTPRKRAAAPKETGTDE